MTCTLIPIDLTSPSEHAELRQQRLACGWHNTPEVFAQWHSMQESGLKSFFWITTLSEDEKLLRAGHISLDAYVSPPDNQLANKEKTNLTIQHFFILPQYRSLGLGSSAMQQLEALAPTEPYGSTECQFVTLNCLSKAHYYDDYLGPIAKKAMPICNQEWYERQGYEVFKEEPRYEDVLPDGREFVWTSAFMRKKVKKQY